MTSPAQRYSQARARQAHPILAEFTGSLPFPLDDFQLRSCQALEEDSSVLVCAPTGAGKTIVGEFAVRLALSKGQKCFYTAPIKALSNQKYHDLCEQHGTDQVGLLTGDNVINSEAPILVMTTEVLRNMLYASSHTLTGLGYVVMDEVHYLADQFRGAVWEEVIIHLPESVTLVSLSATVSNAEEFGDWLVTVRGHTEVVVSEVRPVPLWQHMLVGRRMFDMYGDDSAATSGGTMSGTTGDGKVNPELVRFTQQQLRQVDSHSSSGWQRNRGRGAGRRGAGGPPRRSNRFTPRRADVITRLDREGLLPAIVFIFSRAGCDAAVAQCLHSGLQLTTPEERAAIREIAERHTAELGAEDLQALGYWEWFDGLSHGVAAHHAGMLPAFKQAVEEMFVAGLLKVVFATETLALGINMPARSVVLERLVKFNGESHADITPGEYTQLTGRAGRRGIDVEGHAVVLWSPEVDPRQAAGLASTRTYPLRSSFKPSYNMTVNLISSMGVSAARELLETSFAQFQADRAVVGMARQIQRNKEGIAGYTDSMTCEKGDFVEYANLRRQLSDREKSLSRDATARRRGELAASLEQLTPGDIIAIPNGRKAGLAVVIDQGSRPLAEPMPLVLTEDHWSGKVTMADFAKGPGEVTPLARMKVPKHFNHRSPKARRDLASALRDAARRFGLDDGKPSGKRRSEAADDVELARLREALRRHPCHGCPEREAHARWAVRRDQLVRETDKLERRVRQRTSSLARAFDQVRGILEMRGYVESESAVESGRAVESGAGVQPGDAGHDSGTVTPAGEQLGRIWSEADLLVAECLRHGVWDKLTPPELAAAVSAVVYEPRGGDGGPPPVAPGALRDALSATVRLWGELNSDEADRGLSLTKEPDIGFVEPMLRWASGESLQRTLAGKPARIYPPREATRGELTAGDFVRWSRQVLDLLDQISKVTPAGSGLRSTAMKALTAVRRGVLAPPIP